LFTLKKAVLCADAARVGKGAFAEKSAKMGVEETSGEHLHISVGLRNGYRKCSMSTMDFVNEKERLLGHRRKSVFRQYIARERVNGWGR